MNKKLLENQIIDKVALLEIVTYTWNGETGAIRIDVACMYIVGKGVAWWSVLGNSGLGYFVAYPQFSIIYGKLYGIYAVYLYISRKGEFMLHIVSTIGTL